MTALAMLIGMLPMSLGLGEGGEQNAPLGRAVIGGLTLATCYTLFFVPVMYSVLRRASARAAISPRRHRASGRRSQGCTSSSLSKRPKQTCPWRRRRRPSRTRRSTRERAGTSHAVSSTSATACAPASCWRRSRRPRSTSSSNRRRPIYRQSEKTLELQKATLDLARATMARYQAADAESAVAKEAVDQSVAAVRTAQAAVAAAEATVASNAANVQRLQELTSFERVVAPFAGTVIQRNVDVGDVDYGRQPHEQHRGRAIERRRRRQAACSRSRRSTRSACLSTCPRHLLPTSRPACPSR